ncbi:DUF6128 domain-containing protein [Anaerocolumna sp. AGMB13020]|uniref:DUF6128 domain-containing protein n=1 Tax=Anaerocolumna sp. AGMB13020 TaxID=3081750 RepID=UPI0029552A4C|nr:DUF6128 domain-containing protein [Anaerocolumna sp. AGMB13020]WOO34643.1 DUF6128 domain-containing protein [Anaerocolumna sp. AGMB13020]
MADYKRLVSYMYLYEEGKKRNNIGYARVESRNGQCKYTIHVTALGLNDKQLKVYSFKRNSSGIEGILLGSLLIKNNTGDFKILTDAAHIMNSPYGLDDMGGVILVFSDRKFFAAEWDNKPITMSMVAGIENRNNNTTADTVKNPDIAKYPELVKNPENAKIPETVKTPEEIKAATLAEVLFEYSKPTEEAVQKDNKEEMNRDKSLKDLLTPNFNRIVEQEEEQEIQPGEANKKTIDFEAHIHKSVNSSVTDRNSSPAESPSEIHIENPAALTKNNPVEDSAESENEYSYNKLTENEKRDQPETIDESPVAHISLPEIETPQQSEGEQPSVNQTVNQPQETDTKTESATEGLSNNKPIFDDHPLAKQIYHNFPKMYPFEDNEIAWCARIEPKDIGMLPMDLWGLGNNSFLLHGYYSYRHLIFARVNDKNGQNYILGVPGIYHNREKFMAKMFGFENFKCAKRKPQRTGEFGYWYIPVLLNRGN